MFLTWLGRVYGSNQVDETELKRSTGWAVGSWFVPVISLWWPLQAVRDLWWATTPADRRPGMARQRVVPALVGWWWATWLAYNVVTSIGDRTYSAAKTPDEIRTALVIDATSRPLMLVAAVLAVIYVSRLTARVRPADVGPAPVSHLLG